MIGEVLTMILLMGILITLGVFVYGVMHGWGQDRLGTEEEWADLEDALSKEDES